MVRQWLPKPSSAGSNPVARSKDIQEPFGALFMDKMKFGVVKKVVRVEVERKYFGYIFDRACLSTRITRIDG